MNVAASTSTTLAPYIDALDGVFADGRDKHTAHERARLVLTDMAASPALLTTLLARHLAVPNVLTAEHYPVVSLDIETNAHFGLVANCWIPLPNGDTDVTTKAIHHHGHLLLTTVTAFGPGYEHWMFTTPELIDEASEMFRMRLLDRSNHPVGHAAFVDANIGHVPFYPRALTVTFALWSSRYRTSWKDALKQAPALQKQRQALRKLASSVGLTRALALNIPNYFDFTPAAAGFLGMKERIEFGRGPNTDYLYSLFHVLQGTGNQSLASVVRDALDRTPQANQPLVGQLLDDLEHDRPIDGRLSSGHYGIPHANFGAREIERALEACARVTPSSA